MSASELHRRIIENSKPKYVFLCTKRLQSLCQTHEWPYMARRAFAYAIERHMNMPDLQLHCDTQREFHSSLITCLENGDVDVPCLEQCLDDVIHNRPTLSIHT